MSEHTAPLSPGRERIIRIWHEELACLSDRTSVARRAALGDLLAGLDRAREERDEAFRCRDQAIRALNRDDVDVEEDLTDLFGRHLHGLYDWEGDDAAPNKLVQVCVAAVRPVVAKLTEQRDAALHRRPSARAAALLQAAEAIEANAQPGSDMDLYRTELRLAAKLRHMAAEGGGAG